MYLINGKRNLKVCMQLKFPLLHSFISLSSDNGNHVPRVGKWTAQPMNPKNDIVTLCL